MTDFDMPQQDEKRPVFLLVLCILTFINTGFSFIAGLIVLLTGPTSSERMLDTKVQMASQADQMKSLGMEGLATMFDKLYKITEATNKHHYLVNFSNIAIMLIGAFGAYLMLTGKRLGFHVYIIYSLIASSQLYFFVSAEYIPTILIVFNLLFSGLWIFLYSRNLKWMK